MYPFSTLLNAGFSTLALLTCFTQAFFVVLERLEENPWPLVTRCRQHLLSGDYRNCLQPMPSVSWRAKSPRDGNHGFHYLLKMQNHHE